MRKYIITSITAICCSLALAAQPFQEGFFLDGYTLGFRYNPALANEGDVISIGQVTNRLQNNTGASSFLYPREEGSVMTALHRDVPASTFLGSLKDLNYISGNLNYNIVTYGWRSGDSYHTLEANVHAAYDGAVSKSVFEILKKGAGSARYDIGGDRIGGDLYAELAYGYSREVNSWLRLGGRAKLLVGIESLRYRVNRMDLSMADNKYTVLLESDLLMTKRRGELRTDSEGYMRILGSDHSKKWMLPSGGGLALDLGAVMTPFDGFTLSVSALDLGAMVWYYGNAGRSLGTAEYTGVTDLTLEEIKRGNIFTELRKLGSDFISTLKIKPAEKKVFMKAMPFTVNLAARYEMPFYTALSAGVSASYMGGNDMPYKEVRGNLAWNLSRQLGITANLGAGDYGMVYGAALTAGVKGFHLNVGVQNGFGGTVPYYWIPLKPNNKTVTIGLTYDI